jgi:hypothetical protein
MIGQFAPQGFVCENDLAAPGGPPRKCGQLSQVQVIDSIGRRIGPCCSVEAAGMAVEPLSEREIADFAHQKLKAFYPDRAIFGSGTPRVDVKRALSTAERGATRKVGLLGVAD